jgi:hypothetical protein
VPIPPIHVGKGGREELEIVIFFPLRSSAFSAVIKFLVKEDKPRRTQSARREEEEVR